MLHQLELRDFCVFIHNKKLFEPINLHANPKEIVSIMGVSGSGKSTLLSAISGTLDTEIFTIKGDVLLSQQSVLHTPAHQRGIGMMFQDALLFPHMKVFENLAFALPSGTTKADRTKCVQKALTQIELTHVANRYPYEISGGQQMRVSLMRTLLAKPKAVLLDEPFSKLDVALRQRLRQSVFADIRRRNIPTLMVTHDPSDASATQGDPIIQLSLTD